MPLAKYVLLLCLVVSLSSCVIQSRIGYHQQYESTASLNITGSKSVWVNSIEIKDEEKRNTAIQKMTNIDKAHITPRWKAPLEDYKIPSYIAPDKVEAVMARLREHSDFQYLILTDGGPMPTENNGGTLVEVSIEVWDVIHSNLIYNSHSTAKSKPRMIRGSEQTTTTTIYNATIGTPVHDDTVLYEAFLREIRKLKALY